MEPTLRPGDRVLVDPRAFRSSPPVPGDIVALVDPAARDRWLVKRVAGVGPGEVALPTPGLSDPGERPRIPVPPATVYALSDAPELGRDSRSFGPVPLGELRGRVWYRYAPAGRRGALR